VIARDGFAFENRVGINRRWAQSNNCDARPIEDLALRGNKVGETLALPAFSPYTNRCEVIK
jgi:hypothetical protein